MEPTINNFDNIKSIIKELEAETSDGTMIIDNLNKLGEMEISSEIMNVSDFYKKLDIAKSIK
jgi:hypothetical protein